MFSRKQDAFIKRKLLYCETGELIFRKKSIIGITICSFQAEQNIAEGTHILSTIALHGGVIGEVLVQHQGVAGGEGGAIKKVY